MPEIKLRSSLLRLFFISSTVLAGSISNGQQGGRFHVIALSENGGHHLAYSKRAEAWLSMLATDSNFTVHYLHSTDSINSKLLAGCDLFIQLDFPPYGWKDSAALAFRNYIERGSGGWIGFHHATLLGEFDGFPLWEWFWQFMGSIRFRDYIPAFSDATVQIEDTSHPVTKNLPHQFVIRKEEWYTYDKSPRPNVSVIAAVHERSYSPQSRVTMGDHPVIWSNPRFPAPNIYIFMGHSPHLFDNNNYTTLFRNAIFWAAQKH